MANRRMFSRDIISTDRFLDMPISAQALYFHIGMNADDDGFLDNPRSLARMIGAGKKDLETLEAANYIRTFDSGVITVTDWAKNNSIRKDRYTPTIYSREKSERDGAETVMHVKASEEPKEPECTECFDADIAEPLNEVAQTNQYVATYLGISPGIIEELESFRADGLPEALIRKAVDKSMGSRAKNWNYAKKIMNDWVEKGYKTVAEIEAADEEWERKKKEKAGAQKDHGFQEHHYNEEDFNESFYFDPTKELMGGQDGKR